MRHHILLSLACFAIAASASEQRDRIRIYGLFGNARFVTGDTVPSTRIFGRLYLDKKCSLPVSGAKDMRALYWTNQSLFRTGCWYPTLDNGFVMLYSNGETEKQPSWKVMPKGLLNKDGSAEIIERDFDSETIVTKVMNEEFKERMARRQRGEY